MAQVDSVSIAIIGSGGAGALTVGTLLLEAAGAAGWYGLMTRAVGPQIRGGEAAALVRLATYPIDCHDDRFDLMVAIDWMNANRFEAEIPLTAASLAIGDPKGGEPPASIAAAGARFAQVPFKDIAKKIEDGRANMIVLGLVASLLGLGEAAFLDLFERRFGAKGEKAMAANIGAFRAGAEAAKEHDLGVRLAPAPAKTSPRWLVSGNEATGLGAVKGGVRFAAAYPITPATEILEWLAPNLPKVGGTLVQAEDELASINMIIGASYGGKASITATSGPGLSLMIEALGLATASEVPIVVVDVMRGGPSTGIPTKSEQGDLNIAVYGLHGDAPHLVVAPQSVADCQFATQWAVHLAEAMQAPAIVLSDQFLGQAKTAIARPADIAFIGQRLVADKVEGAYKRYALAASAGHVSPMALPGTPGGQYTADGLTHTERGIPTSSTGDHKAQLDKRRDKLDTFDYGDHWATVEGEGDLAIVVWGSLTGAVREGIARAAAEGRRARLVAPRLLSPVQPARFARALDGVTRTLVVEQTHGAQFHRYLRAHYDLPGEVRVLNRPGPLPIRPGEIRRAIMEWSV